jgi:dihydroflavonol-4-reductase
MVTLVTGASGHIGVNLVQALLARGRKVRVLVHNHPWPLEGLEIEVVKGDICNLESLSQVFHGVDSVYHLAARISIVKNNLFNLEKTNISGTRNVVQACINGNVRRLVHFSSIHALVQKPMNCPVDESRPLVKGLDCPQYDRSKAAGEEEIFHGIEQGLNAVIINPTAIAGPYDYQLSLFGEALLALANGKFPALVDGGFDWVDARDVAEAAIIAEARGTIGSRYLLSGHWASISDIAKLVANISGVPSPKFVCPLWLASTSAPLALAIARLIKKRPLFTPDSIRALNSNRNINHEKATRELGYKPRPLLETIEDTLHWFSITGKLKKPLPERRI